MEFRHLPQPKAGPIGWLLKLLVIIGKFIYYFVRIMAWILRRIWPRK